MQLRGSWPAGKTITIIFLVFAGAVLLYLLLYVIFYGPDSISGISDAYHTYIDGMRDDPVFSDYAGLMMIDGAELDALISQTQSLLKFLPRILPGILAVSFAVISTLNYMVSSNIYKKNRIEVMPFKPFTGWDLPWYYVWGAIAGLILVLIPEIGSPNGGDPAMIDQAADAIGFNLIIIFGALYTILGISVLWGIFARLKLSPLIKVIIIAFLLLFFMIALFIFPLLGLIDIWANFRKLKRN